MQLEFLGTGAGQPSKFRNVSSIALKLLDEINEVWLFDVGEATQHQILNTTIRPRKIKKIFLTHLHGDHIFGLPGFLSSRSFQGSDTEALDDITIYGPSGVRNFVQTALRVSGTRLSYRINYVELHPGVILDDEHFQVTALPLDHQIEAFAFRVDEKERQGEFDIAKAQAEQIPAGPIYGRLKAGEQVKLPDGRIVDGRDYVSANQPGRTVTLILDTRQVPEAVEFARGSDVLVHEATFGSDEAKMARRYYHSTNLQAAELAKAADAKQLWLTHISARYKGEMVREFVRDSREIFANTRVVKDLEEIDIPVKKLND